MSPCPARYYPVPWCPLDQEIEVGSDWYPRLEDTPRTELEELFECEFYRRETDREFHLCRSDSLFYRLEIGREFLWATRCDCDSPHPWAGEELLEDGEGQADQDIAPEVFD